MNRLFRSDAPDASARQRLDLEGHVLLPGLLTQDACTRLTEALQHIRSIMPGDPNYPPNHYGAQHHPYLASLIADPQMVALARAVLGEEIRYDHCFTLNREGGDRGTTWHSHAYADEDSSLGFLRIFLYVNGFEPGDGNLKVVPGSHLFRDPNIGAATDDQLRSGWMKDRVHPLGGEPLAIEELAAPPGSVALMWTHAAHAVHPRLDHSDTRWCVVYGYRNPGAESPARRITPEFITGTPDPHGLFPLY